jgi:hypothetical protein
MTAIHSKSEILRVIESLPDGVSLDEVIERLILIRKVNLGLAQGGEGVPQDTAEAEFSRPRNERRWSRG